MWCDDLLKSLKYTEITTEITSNVIIVGLYIDIWAEVITFVSCTDSMLNLMVYLCPGFMQSSWYTS